MDSQNNYSYVAPPIPQCIDPRLLTDPFPAAYPGKIPDYVPITNDDRSPFTNQMRETNKSNQQGRINEFGRNDQRQQQSRGLFQDTTHQASTGFGAQQPQQQPTNYAPRIPQNPHGMASIGVEAQTHGETPAIWQPDTQIPNPYLPQQQTTLPTSPPYANAGQPTRQTPNRTGRSQSPKSSRPQGVSKSRPALTKEEKLDSHKRAEAIRRNERNQAMKNIVARVPEIFKDGTPKQNSEAHILVSVAEYLKSLRRNNDDNTVVNQRFRTELIKRGAQRSPGPAALMQ